MDLFLRPMSTSQLLDRTFHIYRNNFALLAGIGAVLPAMLLVLQLAFIPLGFPPRAAEKMRPELLAVVVLGYLACYGVIYIFCSAFTTGATVFAVSKLHLGQSITIREAYKQVFSRFWRILGVILLVSLIVFGAVVLGEIIAILIFAIFAGSLTMIAGKGAGVGLGLVFAVIGAICTFVAGLFAAAFLYCKLSLAIPACLLEQLPVGTSLQRAWQLTKNSFWRILLVYLLTWIFSFVLALVLGLPGQLYGMFMQNKAFVLGVVLQHIGGFVAGVVANPISSIAIALIYYDQRIRKEAFDLHLMMEAVGQQSPQPVAITVPPAAG